MRLSLNIDKEALMAINFDSTWVQSVRTLLQQGHFAEAVAHTGRALRSPGNDTNGRLVQLHGLTLYVHGEHEAARDALESALLLSPLTAESLLALADLYIKNNQQKDACVSLNILVEDIDTVPTELLPRIAGLLGKVGEIRKALFVCYRVVDNDPDCDEAIFAAAHYMRKLGYAPNAVICMMRRAVSLAPDNCDYRRSLAAALSINGEIEAAYSLLTSISTDDICCKNCLKLMANVFEQFGDSERLAECQGRLFEIDSGAS